MMASDSVCRRRRRSTSLGVRLGMAAVAIATSLGGRADAQQPALPAPSPPAASLPVASEALPTTNEELLLELKRLRAEVASSRQLSEEVQQLRAEVSALRESQSTFPPAPIPGVVNGSSTQPSGGTTRGLPSIYHSGAAGPEVPEPADADRFPLRGEYRYNHNATGPLGGGGYFSFATLDDEFTLNITNQITVDGTFFDRQNMPTIEQGFNIPFARTYFYGNITKNFSYQIGTQGFLGTYNLLDSWISWHPNQYLTIRLGKGLAPPGYEYYAFSPALEPVVANSPMFQLAAKRPIGAMFSGMLLDRRVQWWSGITNSGTSLYGNLDRNVDYNGAIDVTPFRGERWTDSIWEGLGGGVGVSTGQQQYALNQTSIAFTNNGEATTNPSFVTPVGVPFYIYNSNVSAFGNETRVAPHVYWFGRFSVLAEYMNFSRELVNGAVKGRSTQNTYYINASYWLTGERDFAGHGFQAYSTIEPLRPFRRQLGLWGPGAWQIAAQWSQFNAGSADISRGFVDAARSATENYNVQVGLNWWPNKYTRFTFDYMWTGFNRAIPITGPTPVSQYNTFWVRWAMFF
jgi:phosphate-selective porin OprO and OprP